MERVRPIPSAMTPGEYEQLLHDAEVRLARLRALYEQYFQGIEKLEPTVPRKELDRLLELLRKSQPRNTALRFRTQMLIAKYGTYVTYWQRVARQIEEGTYRRDVVRAQQRRLRENARVARPEREAPGAWEIDVDVGEVERHERFDFDDSDVDAILGALAPSEAPAPSVPPPRRLSVFGSALPPRASQPPPETGVIPRPAPAPGAATFARPATAVFGRPVDATFAKPAAPAANPAVAPSPARPPAGSPPPAASSPPPTVPRVAPPARPIPPPARPPAPPPPRPAPPSGLDDARMRTLYDHYVEARRRNNERVDNVKYETLAQSVQQMLPKLRERHGDRKIDFEVVVQNGKVGLKPKVGG